MYKECLECKKLGNPCDGPNFMAMNTDDLIHWCNERKKQLPGLTYDRIVEQTGLSKGTVSGFFSGKHTDYRIETVRPILKMLVGGEWENSPCGDPTAEERARYEDKIRQLEADIAWRDDKINHILAEEKYLKEQIANERATIKTLKRALIAVSTLLGLALTLIIIALIVDRLNGDMGFFWLDGLLKPHGINEIIQRWRT